MFARVDIDVTEFRTKTPKKKKKKILGQFFFFQKSARASRFQRGIFLIFSPQKNLLLVCGGGITSKLASQWPSWGIYNMPHLVFGAKDVCYILKKRCWPASNDSFLGRRACMYLESDWDQGVGFLAVWVLRLLSHWKVYRVVLRTAINRCCLKTERAR